MLQNYSFLLFFRLFSQIILLKNKNLYSLPETFSNFVRFLLLMLMTGWNSIFCIKIPFLRNKLCR